MQLFYSEEVFIEKINSLNEEESHHVSKVLRLKKGDIFHLTDGKGSIYKCIIIDVYKSVTYKVIEIEKIAPQRSYYLHIAMSPTKNIERFEFFIEKSVEIGIDEITPIICKRSERKIVKKERLEKIAISAIKQSIKPIKPKINDLTDFEAFIKNFNADYKYIAIMNGDYNIKTLKNPGNYIFLIGPEGDFDNNEIFFAQKNNYQTLSLGSQRLRTETAGIFIATALNILL